jgi:hypothetical protein
LFFPNRHTTPPFANTKRFLAASIVAVPIIGVLSLTAALTGGANAQVNCQTFTETGKTVCGRFLDYWQRNGGLAQQGFPISDQLQEVSATDGKSYTVQYFERAVFELHPENAAPYDVLLSLLGVFEYKQRYGDTGAPYQAASTNNSVLFKETGKTVGGSFLIYWQSHGGLAQQGYPISDEFTEVSALDGKPYTVQYFERAVFEKHPENAPPYDVLLSQLGTFRYNAKSGARTGATGNNGIPTDVPTVPAAVPTQSGQIPGPQPTTVAP